MGNWGNAAGGAASGAAAGTAILPGWGTAIGAGIGGLAGYFGGGNADEEARRKAAADAQANYARLGAQLDAQIAYQQRIARGEESVSAEQLRQGLQQNLGAQQSWAAGASPQNSAMAGLQASRNAMNLGAGLAGQTAQAGIMERQAAQAALNQLLLQRQQLEQQATGQAPAGQSWLQQWGPAIQGGLQAYGASAGKKPEAPQGQSQRPTPNPALGGWGSRQPAPNRGF